MYQWNFNIKLQFTNFPLFISDADFQSKSNNWIPWSRSTILYLILILILILIFILGETRARDRESVWSLDQHQQQQQLGICLDINTYYGIVSYAVGVSLILSVAGIKSGRRFFHLFNRRHAARHTGQILGNGHDGRVNHRPQRDQEEPLELPVWWEAWNRSTACWPIIRIRKSDNRSRVCALLLLDSESVARL